MSCRDVSFTRVMTCSIVALVGFAASAVAADDLDTRFRPFGEGPLSARDYLAEKPNDENRFWAFTFTDIRYIFRYRSMSRGDAFIATLTEIDVFAVVARHKSWNVRPDDEALLDHEQGHFDLSQTLALEGKIKILKLVDAGDPPTATGSSPDEAAQKLDTRLRELLTKFFVDQQQMNRDYDRLTNNGRNATAQAEHRKRQLEALIDVRRRLKEVESR